jgi:uncharacterized protein YkwD
MASWRRLFAWVLAVTALALIGAASVEAGPPANCGPTDWCRPGSKEGEKAYRALRRFLSYEYPERLVQQIDKLPRCAECMSDPRAFVIEVVYAGSNEVKTQKWSAAEEVRHLDMLARGVITRFRIRYAGDDCDCCDDQTRTSTVPWVDQAHAYDPPHDLTDVPPVPRPDPVKRGPYPPPPAEAHPSCQSCAKAADDYNKLVDVVWTYKKERVDVVYQLQLANADSQRCSEYATFVDEIPVTDANRAQVAKAQAQITAGLRDASARVESWQARLNVIDARLPGKIKELQDAWAALLDCEAKMCRVAPSTATTPQTPASVSTVASAAPTGACPSADAVLAEINAARVDPPAYAAKLRKYRAWYQGKLVREPGDPVGRMTTEGTAAVDDAIAWLEKLPPRPPLKMSPELASAAARFAADAGSAGLVGHVGSNGSTVGGRFLAAGVRAALREETIALSAETAEAAVRQLIIDDGVSTRGHRSIIFEPSLMIAGVGCGPHKTWKFMFVVDFAGMLMPAPGSESGAAAMH